MSTSRRLALVAFLFLLGACAQGVEAPTPEARGDVVAILDGEEIRAGDLDAWIRDDLYDEATRDKDPSVVYEFRRSALDRMITGRLLEEETARRGVEIGELHGQIVEPAKVGDEEIRAFYEENQARMGGAPYDEIAPQIRGYLVQERQGEIWSVFLAGLREQADLSVAMVPPRVDVAGVGPFLGPEGAPVTIVEFSDFNCPYCMRVGPTLKALRERYPEQVRIVFRHFPLDGIHPRARPIAEASVCADAQGHFWPFHDRVFEDGAAMADPAIAAAAQELGLDMAAFTTCLASEGTAATVQRDVDAGVAAGVTGTPAFFVNGIRLSGARDVDAFVEIIERELAETS